MYNLIFFLQNINPLHSSAHALNNQITLSSNSPKSPSQLHVLPACGSVAIPTASATVNSSTTNLMSTSLNSTQIHNHINPTGSSSGVGALSIHSATAHVPSVMSTSLHSGAGGVGGTGISSGTGSIPFDNNGSSWSTASLSPTIPSQHRKCEVKLNAMPYVFYYFFLLIVFFFVFIYS